MARNDVYININALSPADAVVTGQQDMTAATVPELVLGDTPTFNFYFTDNTNVWPSWAGNASYSLTWALSDAVAGDFSPAATTGNATPITGGWSVVLPLNSYDLVGLLNTKRVGQPYPVTNLWQQLRVTDPSGNEITRAMFWTPVRYRAISDTQNTESASPTGGRFVTVNNVNTLTTPTAAQFYAANPVPTSALGTASNGELLIGNGTGFTKSTLTAGTGITVTNGSGSITIDASGAQETLTATVKNAESVAITKGQVVYLFGATGGFASVKLAYNTSDATSAKTFGVVSSTSIAANGTGTVTCVGVVDGLNLGAYNDGDTLYLGATPGSVTATKPYAPNHLVYVGIVERANNGNGELYVRVQNGYELDEIHDVQINAPKLAGQTLIYDQTNDLWKNARLTGTANQITVTNADAAVTLSIPTNPTLPGNLTVSGTTDSSSKDTGAIVTEGGLGVEKSATIGGNLTVSGSTSIGSVFNMDAGNSTGTRTLQFGSTFNSGTFNFQNGLTPVMAITSGRVHFPATARTDDGGPTVPGWGFINESGMGLYRVSANNLGFAINNANAATLNTTGLSLTGNLTVSGTGTSTFASNLTLNGSKILTVNGSGNLLQLGDGTGTVAILLNRLNTSSNSNFYWLTAGALKWAVGVGINAVGEDFEFYSYPAGNTLLKLGSTTGNLLIGTTTDNAGKVQVYATGSGIQPALLLSTSGTTTSDGVGLLFTANGYAQKMARIHALLQGNDYADLIFSVGDGADSYAEAFRVSAANRNLLLGTTTDSANGKLQLATHTTSAGGIGFGTETSLYRIDTGALALDHVGGSAPRFVLRSNGTIASNLEVSTGDLYFDNRGVGKSLYLRTTTSGGTTTTALTLDSSQNATFANEIRGTGNLVAVATSGTNGNVYLRAKGTGYVRVDTGSGFRVETGKVSFTSLPTSSAGLSAGDIWNDGGTLKIV